MKLIDILFGISFILASIMITQQLFNIPPLSLIVGILTFTFYYNLVKEKELKIMLEVE